MTHMRVNGQLPIFIGSEIYRGSSYGPTHPLRVARVSTVMDLARALDWLPKTQYLTSPRAKPKALEGFHTAAYLKALVQAEALQSVSQSVRTIHGLGTPSNPVFAQMYRRPATSAGGAMMAGELLKHGGTIYVPGGGTHHGMPDRANGFCYLNDPVLAIQSLRRQGVRRIAYVDIDAHHPDGVAHAFATDPDTVLISTHEENRWPRTGALHDIGAGQVWNMPLPRGCHDDDFALVRDAVLLPVVQAFRPEAIVLQCGADAVQEDPQSRMCLSNNAHIAVVSALQGMAPRYLVLGGGGYNPWSVGRCWTRVWATLNRHDTPKVLPDAAQQVLGDLRWDGQRRGRQHWDGQHWDGQPPDHWTSTLCDPHRGGPISDRVRDLITVMQARIRATCHVAP